MKTIKLNHAAGILFILIFLNGACAESVTVSRDLPDSASSGSKVSVSLKIDVVGSDISGLIVTEILPEGWDISSVSNDGSFDKEKGEIRWLMYGENVESQSLSYAAVPSGSGEYVFSGTYTTLEEGISETEGDDKITVKETALGGEGTGGYNNLFIIGIIALVAVIILGFILTRKKK